MHGIDLFFICSACRESSYEIKFMGFQKCVLSQRSRENGQPRIPWMPQTWWLPNMGESSIISSEFFSEWLPSGLGPSKERNLNVVDSVYNSSVSPNQRQAKSSTYLPQPCHIELSHFHLTKSNNAEPLAMASFISHTVVCRGSVLPGAFTCTIKEFFLRKNTQTHKTGIALVPWQFPVEYNRNVSSF